MTEKLKTLLVKNADYLVTMDDQRRILREVSLYIEGNRIVEVDSRRQTADQVIDATGMKVLPGFVNAHHHLFQAFMRHVPAMQNQRIDKWIEIVSSLGKRMSLAAHYYAGLVNMIELLFSGCTTTTDMMYFFPRNLDHLEVFGAYVRAAQTLGMRFHPFRGSMSLSQKDGALFDDEVVESSEEIVKRTRETIERFHDSTADSMLKVGIAPCTSFTSTDEDYQGAVVLAQEYNVNLQTHAGESSYEQEHIREKYGTTPVRHLSDLGWCGPRVSLAHCIEVDGTDIGELAHDHTSVCHCPISNSRKPLGQAGIAPIWEMLAAGLNVAMGTDGSAGNDASNILEEMRWARTMQGARPEATYLQAMEVLHMGTMGGAKALRWQDQIGSLEEGKCADIAIFDTRGSIAHVGAWDEVGALISCQAVPVTNLIINGQVVIERGQLVGQDFAKILAAARECFKETFGRNS